MKRKKLLKTLAEFLDQEGRKQRKRRAELTALLEKLQRKRHELERKISEEKDEHRHRRLSKELEIVKAQREKGLKTLQDLEA